MNDFSDVTKKLEDLRTLETQLWVEHRERQEYDRETFGERYFDAEGDTIFSRAAQGLSGLLDALEEIVAEAVDAEDYAKRTGEYGENGMVPVDTIHAVLTEHLKGDA